MNRRATPVARLRRARRTDAVAILALEEHFPGDRFSAASVRHLLRSASAAVWVAETLQRPTQVVGAAMVLTRRGARVARLYSLVVSPAARGQGLGDQLVAQVERYAKVMGHTAVSLEVRVDNAAARTLYARRGYHEHARLPAYYEDGAPGLRLRKTF